MTIESMIKKKKELGLSCRELSELGDIPLATVQKVFSGATKTPRSSTIKALEKVFIKLAKADTFSDSVQDSYISCCSMESSDNVDILREGAVKYASDDIFDERDHSHTVEEYLSLPDNIRAELIDGRFYEMLAPSYEHQELLMSIAFELLNHVKKNKGKCKVLPAPFDIQLDKDNKTMVQPDIVVICDKNKINEKRGFGAPDMIVEILSPSTARKDWTVKLAKYMSADVREYWIVDPKNKIIVVFYDDGGEDELIPEIYHFDSKVPVHIWNGKCKIDFSQINTQI